MRWRGCTTTVGSLRASARLPGRASQNDTAWSDSLVRSRAYIAKRGVLPGAGATNQRSDRRRPTHESEPCAVLQASLARFLTGSNRKPHYGGWRGRSEERRVGTEWW